MITDRHPDSYQPLIYWGKIPVYATTLLVVAYTAAMILTAILVTSGASELLNRLVFLPSAVTQQFEVWRMITYAFVNAPSLWFIVEMFLLYYFGREVERFIGRRAFLAMYGIFLLIAPLTLCIIQLIPFSIPLENLGFSGSFAIQFAVFIAFCTVYPHAQFFFGISAKWMAIILLTIQSLQSLTAHSWGTLIALWSTSITAFFMLNRQANPFRFFQNWQAQCRSKRSLRALKSADEPQDRNPLEEMDSLLDKISRKGISSLTRKERQMLQTARKHLLKREKNP